MNSKYHPREVQAQEALALFWDDEKKDYIFPSREKMDDFIKRFDSKKPAEAERLFVQINETFYF